MQRIDTSTKATDLFGVGKHGFRDGDPIAGTPATRLNAAFFNGLQEEVANVIEGAGIALVPGSYDQLLAAIRSMGLLAQVHFGSSSSSVSTTSSSYTTHQSLAVNKRRASNGILWIVAVRARAETGSPDPADAIVSVQFQTDSGGAYANVVAAQVGIARTESGVTVTVMDDSVCLLGRDTGGAVAHNVRVQLASLTGGQASISGSTVIGLEYWA